SFYALPPPPPPPTLFPYTTLFRSSRMPINPCPVPRVVLPGCLDSSTPLVTTIVIIGLLQVMSISAPPLPCLRAFVSASCTTRYRSEEHTSELQSRENLVCRLLLEK